MKKLVALLALLPALALAAETDVAPPAAPEAPKPAPSVKEQAGGFGLLLQGWFQADSDARFNAGVTKKDFSSNGGGGQPNAGYSTFKIRRSEISYDNTLGGLFGYHVMVDPARIQNGNVAVPAETITCKAGATAGAAPTCTAAATSLGVKDILQDAWFSAYVLPYTELRLGQMKTPLTMEGFGSSAKLDFAERSFLGNNFGNQRDIGLMAASTKDLPFVEYEVGVFNGTGQNVYDNQPTKDVAGRVVLKPIPGVSVGASGAIGGTFDPAFGGGLVKKTKNRGGVEAALEYAGFTVKGEWMGGREGQAPDAAALVAKGGSATFYSLAPVGYYLTAGYRYDAAQYGIWNLVARYDHWDSDSQTPVSQCKGAPSTAAAGAFAGNARCVKDTTVSVGLNYEVPPKLVKNVKLQLDYYRNNDDARDVSADEVFFVTQLKF
ncbi:porin [Anaeromyxobacter paludicola]|uniref:Phosphate-selective porin O and P n=1 Tax=Anaeromyxobacter paludicola TaxID=2918171 RepID=A0ABM7XBU0_9BACT|nr:porin [Anaeromyxobacter paludicola]BDG09331.1 hypothetical protein AMPC_24440 [Anaeromyxobacter paludicola]